MKSVVHPPGLRSKSLLPRLLLLAIAGYLVVDLAFIHGPASRTISSFLQLFADDTGLIAARVAGFPISRSQLERATSERLWLQGKSPTDVSPADLAAARQAALDDLIDDALLRLQTQALKTQLAVTDAELDARFARFAARFESPEILVAAMKSQGIPDEAALRARLAARIQQEKFLALRLGPATRVSVDEAREWFEKHGKSVASPERIEARHIFIPTLNQPPEEAKQKLAAALAELTEKKKDFSTLAKEQSEDPATKDQGGQLGWMTRDRLPADFAAAIFALETGKPELIQSSLGWHLVEVTAHKPAAPRSFDQAKPEIVAALEAKKRRTAIAELRQSLRNRGAASIEIFPAS